MFAKCRYILPLSVLLTYWFFMIYHYFFISDVEQAELAKSKSKEEEALAVGLKASNPILGSICSLISSFFIGVSFILQKQGNLQVNKARADDSIISTNTAHPKPIHKSSEKPASLLGQMVWWYGIASLITGEIIQIFAYKYAPTTLIAPLGAFRVIFTTTLSRLYLKEGITSNAKVGIIISLIGALIITVHAPRKELDKQASEVLSDTSAIFKLYFMALLIYTSAVAWRIYKMIYYRMATHGVKDDGENQGDSHLRTSEKTIALLATLQTCSLGAIGVLCTKLLTMLSFGDFGMVNLIVILGIVSTSPSQVYYVNIALKYDKASKITPVKYAGTNILIVIGSILLFNEWVVLDAGDTFGMTCGLLIAVCGIRLVVQE